MVDIDSMLTEERCHMLREIEFFIEMSGAEQLTRLSDQLPTLKQYQHHRLGTGAVGACLALTEYVGSKLFWTWC